MKYQLEIDENQAKIITEALDIYSRIGVGQLEIITEHLRFNGFFKDKTKELEWSEDLLMVIKNMLFDMPHNGNLGIHSRQILDRYRVAYDLYKVIEHQFWLDRGKEDRDTASFSVHAYEPKTSVPDQPLAIIKHDKT